MIVAPLSAQLAHRIGTKLVVAAGLTLRDARHARRSRSSPTDSSYWPDVVWRMMLMASGMALTMAPATESIMGSLPLAKAGVGSAVNDTTRQVGGALGVAVVGSVLSSIYGSQMADFLAGKPVNTAHRRRRSRSRWAPPWATPSGIAGTRARPRRVAGERRPRGVRRRHARGVLVAAGATLIGAVIAASGSRRGPTTDDVADQEAAHTRRRRRRRAPRAALTTGAEVS